MGEGQRRGGGGVGEGWGRGRRVNCNTHLAIATQRCSCQLAHHTNVSGYRSEGLTNSLGSLLVWVAFALSSAAARAPEATAVGRVFDPV